MDFLTILFACWLYAGRSLLLAVYHSENKFLGIQWTIAHRFTAGLLIAPILFAISSWLPTPFYAVLALLILVDIILLLLIFVNGFYKKINVTPSILLSAGFILLCLVLASINGPFIEHLSDAWWHMRGAAWILNNENLALSSDLTRHAGFFSGWLNWIGINFTSYRTQGFLAWVTHGSIVNSWIASGIAICGLLGASVLMLFSSLSPRRLVLVLAIIFWLVQLGGMHTGFRLTAWPAGMSYVFLNLGLLASYQLFCCFKSRSAWYLLGLSIAGMAFFHIGAIFLILVPVACLWITKALFFSNSLFKTVSSMVIGVLVIGALFIIERLTWGYQPPYAFGIVGLIFVGVALVAILMQIGNNWIARFGIIMLLVLCVYGVVDWKFFAKLFSPAIPNQGSYYSAYMPDWFKLVGKGLFRLPKWEHQLRASLLWAGVVSIPLAIWLCWIKDSYLSRWLMVLMLVPWLILISPAMFTVIAVFVPAYGIYRVQFLMPIALTLGLATTCSWEMLTSSGNEGNNRLFGLERYIKNKWWLHATQRGLVLFLLFVTYIIFSKALANFAPNFESVWFKYVLILAGICLMVLNISAKKVIGFAIASICILAIMPDLLSRTGVINDRPWALHSNQGFHWRLQNNRDAIRAHTSWRYQSDIRNIKNLIGKKTTSKFISDLATSYYVAAETALNPMVQHGHHSTSGKKFNNEFQSFCRGEISESEYLTKLKKHNSNDKKPNQEKIRFIITNGDSLNYTAESLSPYCVGENEKFHLDLEKIAVNTYSGDYLSLWEVPMSNQIE